MQQTEEQITKKGKKNIQMPKQCLFQRHQPPSLAIVNCLYADVKTYSSVALCTLHGCTNSTFR